MAHSDLPSIIQEINKTAKRNVIAPLSKAKALELKRYPSGSFGIDYITGGGYAYKRILMLYGHKSAGKNSQLNQMLAYNQRICRNCHSILPQYGEATIKDRWTYVLQNYMMLPTCHCKQPEAKRFLLLDYEKSISSEKAKTSIVISHVDPEGVTIDENQYTEKVARLDEIKASKGSATPEEKTEAKEIEKWLSSLTKNEELVERIPQTDYIRQCGVDTDALMVADPEYTDDGIDIVKKCIRSKEIDGIIWDSLQAGITKFTGQREAEQNDMGVDAKKNGLLMRQIVSAYSAEADLLNEQDAYRPTVFITSQVRSELGVMYAKPDSFSGGNAVGHHISLALEVKRECFLDKEGNEGKWGNAYYGQRTRVRAEKNKLSAPGDMFVYDYYFRATDKFDIGSIDHVGEITTLGVMLGLIEQSGPMYYCNGESFKGKATLRDALANQPEFTAKLYSEIIKRTL